MKKGLHQRTSKKQRMLVFVMGKDDQKLKKFGFAKMFFYKGKVIVWSI
jgi:hypothetical protein